jgi:hypothetical protein
VVKYEEKDDHDNLVEELTPTLHQEGHGDFSATVEAVLLRRNLTRSGSVLHGCGGSHWIFSTNTNTVEQQGQRIADNPSVQRSTPRRSEHQKTNEHDNSILNKTPSTTNTKKYY